MPEVAEREEQPAMSGSGPDVTLAPTRLGAELLTPDVAPRVEDGWFTATNQPPPARTEAAAELPSELDLPGPRPAPPRAQLYLLGLLGVGILVALVGLALVVV